MLVFDWRAFAVLRSTYSRDVSAVLCTVLSTDQSERGSTRERESRFFIKWDVTGECGTRSALDRAHLPLTTAFRCRKNHASLLRRSPNTSMWDFPDVIKFHIAVHTT